MGLRGNAFSRSAIGRSAIGRSAIGQSNGIEPRATLARRRRIALLGAFAILFQALLFGWHSHPLLLAWHGAPAISAATNNAPVSPAGLADDCDICATLHHHGAAPIVFVALALPPVTAARVYSFILALFARVPARAFQARAPPRA
jgi:hypothetical protein